MKKFRCPLCGSPIDEDIKRVSYEGDVCQKCLDLYAKTCDICGCQYIDEEIYSEKQCLCDLMEYFDFDAGE